MPVNKLIGQIENERRAFKFEGKKAAIEGKSKQ